LSLRDRPRILNWTGRQARPGKQGDTERPGPDLEADRHVGRILAEYDDELPPLVAPCRRPHVILGQRSGPRGQTLVSKHQPASVFRFVCLGV
jgi:hypothetical protein